MDLKKHANAIAMVISFILVVFWRLEFPCAQNSLASQVVILLAGIFGVMAFAGIMYKMAKGKLSEGTSDFILFCVLLVITIAIVYLGIPGECNLLGKA